MLLALYLERNMERKKERNKGGRKKEGTKEH